MLGLGRRLPSLASLSQHFLPTAPAAGAVGMSPSLSLSSPRSLPLSLSAPSGDAPALLASCQRRTSLLPCCSTSRMAPPTQMSHMPARSATTRPFRPPLWCLLIVLRGILTLRCRREVADAIGRELGRAICVVQLGPTTTACGSHAVGIGC